MTEPTPGAAEPIAETGPPTSGAALTDDQAEALLADAVADAEALNSQEPGDAPSPGNTRRNDFDKLPRWAQKELRQARNEALNLRASRNELAQQVGRAFGFVQDDEPADPAKLTEQLTAASKAASKARTALAVYRAAGGANGDPAALLDSLTFLEKVEVIDPSDADAVTAAISEAVAANPRLGKPEPAQPGMKRNPAQGASASPPLGIAEQVAAAEKAGDIRTAIRLKSAQVLTTTDQ